MTSEDSPSSFLPPQFIQQLFVEYLTCVGNHDRLWGCKYEVALLSAFYNLMRVADLCIDERVKALALRKRLGQGSGNMNEREVL